MCQVPAGRVDEGERTGEKTWNFKYHVNVICKLEFYRQP